MLTTEETIKIARDMPELEVRLIKAIYDVSSMCSMDAVRDTIKHIGYLYDNFSPLTMPSFLDNMRN